MPYTEKARRFFNLCKHNPGKAKGKCSSRKDSAKLADEANRLMKKKHFAMPRKNKAGYY